MRSYWRAPRVQSWRPAGRTPRHPDRPLRGEADARHYEVRVTGEDCPGMAWRVAFALVLRSSYQCEGLVGAPCHFLRGGNAPGEAVEPGADGGAKVGCSDENDDTDGGDQQTVFHDV